MQTAQSSSEICALCYACFDILHLNGRDLLELPLAKRLEILARVVTRDPHKLEIAEQWPVQSMEGIAGRLSSLTEAG